MEKNYSDSDNSAKETEGIYGYYEDQANKLKHVHAESRLFPPLAPEIEERLRVLTRVADVLGLDDVSFCSYSAAISRLSSEQLSSKRSLSRLEFVESKLRDHLASTRHEEQLILKWTDAQQSELDASESVATLDRRADAIRKKAKEYQAELDSLMADAPDQPAVTITELAAQQERIRKKEQDLKSKRAKIKAFKGLPPNLDLARLELRDARDEQMKLIQLRERLLGKMADAVA